MCIFAKNTVMGKALLFLVFYSLSCFVACYAQNTCLQKMNEGHTMMQAQQYEKAISKFDSVLACLPDVELYSTQAKQHTLCTVHFNKGTALYMLKRYELAIRSLILFCEATKI
jgi:tetratricopeptide (TPR) repeat protein